MTEKPDAPWLIALANDVSDGRAVDWDSVASSPGYAESEATVAELRSLATVVEAHRTLGGAVRPLAASEDSAPSGVWRHLVLLEPIGRGAFGAVSRAWDSHLDREVALKLLSAGSGRSPLEEARHLARVRHPNVVAVYGAEQVEQDVGIWMEFIEGETLASMVRDRGPMSAREVVGVGIDLCRAVSALHRATLLHGDIKAQNVMREVGGRVVLMDFSGVRPPDAAGSSTALSGTPLYIAPEVFQGRSPSFTADIYSVGVLLFHLLSGRFPVEGVDLGEIRRRHARGHRTRLRDVRPGLPDPVIHVVERAVAIDPAQRFQAVGELEDALTSIFAAPAAGVHSPDNGDHERAHSPGRWHFWVIAAGLVMFATLGAAAIARRSQSGAMVSQPPVQFTVGPPYNTGSWPRISPDGRLLTFGTIVEGRTLLWVRSLDALEGRPLAGTETSETPFWSADSRRLGFVNSGKLKTVDVVTGRIETVTDVTALHGGDWSRRGGILFADAQGIFQVSPGSSARVPITTVNTAQGEYQHAWPEFLPDGRHFLYLVRSYQEERAGVFLGSVDSAARKKVMPAYSRVVYAASGQLFFVRDGTLFAHPFNSSAGTLSGEATALAKPIKFHPGSDAAFDVSESGILVYRLNEGLASTRVTLFDRRGREIRALTAPGFFRHPRFSPDSTRIAVERSQDDSSNPDIWLLDSSRDVAARFTTDAAPDVRPVWSPDGRRLAFSSKRGTSYDIYVKSIDARDDEQLLWRSDGEYLVEDWSPDGATLSVNVVRSGLWTIPLDRRRKPSLIRTSLVAQTWHSEFSRDGRWLAYTSADSGVSEVYVEPVSAGGARWRVSSNGGAEPHWRADSRELFYLSLDGWITAMTVPVGPAWNASVPHRLFRASVPEVLGGRDFSVAQGGELFAVNNLEGDPAVPPIRVVVNWERLIRH